MNVNWTKVPHGEINAATQRLWVALGDRAGDVAARVNSDSDFVANVARFMMNGGYEPTTSQRIAREIMGKNFFGVEEATKHFGVNPKWRGLDALDEVPFSEEVLKLFKNTHILVAVFPLSILDIRGAVRELEGQTIFYSQDWYNKETFAKQKGKVSWQLVRKEPVVGSTSKTWEQQQEILPKDEVTPKAQVMVYTMVGHFLNTGERLFERIYVRCSDLASGGNRVYVGYFDSDGLRVYDYWDDNRGGRLGLSAARK